MTAPLHALRNIAQSSGYVNRRKAASFPKRRDQLARRCGTQASVLASRLPQDWHVLANAPFSPPRYTSKATTDSTTNRSRLFHISVLSTRATLCNVLVAQSRTEVEVVYACEPTLYLRAGHKFLYDIRACALQTLARQERYR